MMSCLMLVNNTFLDSMAILSGLYKYLFDNFIIFAGSVAENNRVCFSVGRYCRV